MIGEEGEEIRVLGKPIDHVGLSAGLIFKEGDKIEKEIIVTE